MNTYECYYTHHLNPFPQSSSRQHTHPEIKKAQSQFGAQVAGLRQQGHMWSNDTLPPPVRKVRRGWIKMPNSVIGREMEAIGQWEGKTPIITTFENYARAHPTFGKDDSRMTSRRPRASRTSDASTTASTESSIRGVLFADEDGYDFLDEDCPDSPDTSATSLSPSSSDDTSDAETCLSTKDSLRSMKAVQEALEVLEVQGLDALVYHLYERSRWSRREAELVGYITPVVIAEAKTMGMEVDGVLRKFKEMVLERFAKYWSVDGQWRQDIAALTRLNAGYTELKPTSLGVLIGSLFRHNVLSSIEVHKCLDDLVEGYVSYHHLVVMRAIVKHSNSRLCASDEERLATAIFARKLVRVSPHTGKYVWGWNQESAWLRSDIEVTLDKWCDVEKRRQEKERGKKMNKANVNMKQLSMLGKRTK